MFSKCFWGVKTDTTYYHHRFLESSIQNLKGSFEILENLNSEIKTRNQEACFLFMLSPGRPLSACKWFGMRFPWKTHCLLWDRFLSLPRTFSSLLGESQRFFFYPDLFGKSIFKKTPWDAPLVKQQGCQFSRKLSLATVYWEGGSFQKIILYSRNS